MEIIENILSQQHVQRLGWTLVHFVWQAAAIAFLLAITLKILRKSSANLRYVIACMALVLIVLIPAVTIRMIDVSVVETIEPVKQAPVGLPKAGADAQVVIEMPQAESPPLQAAVSPRVPLKDRFIEAVEPALPFIVVGWLVGVFGLSLWHLGGWTQLQRLRRQMVKQVEPSLKAKLQQLANALAIRKTVGLVESALVQVPTVVGHLKPVILLPASALTGLSPDQIEAILAHELAHIKRCDYLVNILQTVVEILGFYHPAVWWVSHKIRVERENCCDDIAVSLCSDSLCYAKALTSMEEMRGRQPALAVAASGGSLLMRIRRLLIKDSTNETKLSWLPSAIAILLIAGLLIPTAWAMANRLSKDAEPSAVGLVRLVRESENWLHRIDSFYTRIEVVQTQTSEAIEKDRKQSAKRGRRERLQTQLRTKITYEFAFDKMRVRMLRDDPTFYYQLKVWDGNTFMAREKSFPTGEEGLVLRPAPSFREFMARDTSWPRSQPHSFWFDKKDKEQLIDVWGSEDCFVLKGRENYRGVECYVLECKRESLPDIKWYVGVEDKKLYGLKTFRNGKNRTEHWCMEYRQVTNGCWMPMKQGYEVYETDSQGNSHLTLRMEYRVAELRVNQPLQDHLFELEFGEAEEKSRERIELGKKLLVLGKACIAYAEEHEEKFPNSLEDIKSYIAKGEDFEWIATNVEYLGRKDRPSGYPQGSLWKVAYDKTLLKRREGTNILFDSGQVEFKGADELEKYGVRVAQRTTVQVEGEVNEAQRRIDGPKWVEGKAMMGTLATAIRAWTAENDPDGNWDSNSLTFTDLDLVKGDFKGNYFDESNFSWVVVRDRNAGKFLYKIKATAGEGIKYPAAITLDEKGNWKDVPEPSNKAGVKVEERFVNRIEGRVIDFAGSPIVAAAVQWFSASERDKDKNLFLFDAAPRLGEKNVVLTDKQGRFAFEAFGTEDFGVHVKANGFAQQLMANLDFPMDAEKLKVIMLLPESKLFGKVVKDGKAVPDARVSVNLFSEQLREMLSSPWPNMSVHTDKDGYYAIAGLPAGELSIGVNSSHANGNLNMIQKTVRLEQGQEVELNFGDEFGFVLTGRVVIGEKPLEMSSVSLKPTNGRFVKWDWTNSKGEFRITGIPEGDYRILTEYNTGLDPNTFQWSQGEQFVDFQKVFVNKDLTINIDLAKKKTAGKNKPGVQVEGDKSYIPSTSTINENGHIVDKIDYPFVNDPEVIGGWKSVDFVEEMDEFDPTKKSWKGVLYLNNLIFEEGGDIAGNILTWTKGLVLSDDTASKYIIREINGSTYMFFEWKSGDYTIRHMRPHYYVLRKVLTESLKYEPMFGKKAYIPPTSTINEKGHIVDKIDYPFVNDPEVIGIWKSVDFVDEMEQFKVGEQRWTGRGGKLFLHEMIFGNNGRLISKNDNEPRGYPGTWTKGLVIYDNDTKTASKYTFKEIDDSTYMFYEWKSGDYTFRHSKPSYYVLKKVSSETADEKSGVKGGAKVCEIVAAPQILTSGYILSVPADLPQLKEIISDDKSKAKMITPEKLEEFLKVIDAAPEARVIAAPKLLTNDNQDGEIKYENPKDFESIKLNIKNHVKPDRKTTLLELEFAYSVSVGQVVSESEVVTTAAILSDHAIAIAGGIPLDGQTVLLLLKPEILERQSSKTGVVKTEKPDVEAEGFRRQLEEPVTVHIDHSPENEKLSVQYAVMAVCKAAGVPYNWDKSAKLADPEHRQYIEPVNIQDKVASQAIMDMLGLVGLLYCVDENGVYLCKAAKGTDDTP